MSQFAVYRNISTSSKGTYPYFIDVQNEMMSDLGSRVVIPLVSYDAKAQLKKLTPIAVIENKRYMVMTNLMTTISVKNLNYKNFVCEVQYMRDEIFSAIDILITGI